MSKIQRRPRVLALAYPVVAILVLMLSSTQAVAEPNSSSRRVSQIVLDSAPSDIAMNQGRSADFATDPGEPRPGYGNTCLATIDLPSHYGPTDSTPYASAYTGTRTAGTTPVMIDSSKVYGTTVTGGTAYQPVAELPTNASGQGVSSVAGIFSNTAVGLNATRLGSVSGASSWAGLAGEDLTTMALDGGNDGQREGTSYFWFWGYGTEFIPANPARPGTNNIAVAVFPNNSDGSLGDNNKPSSILFVPRPDSAINYWSGGEVHQPTGRIYFTGGEDSTLGAGGSYRIMIFDPQTGDYLNPGPIHPKTDEDRIRFDGTLPASDVVVDAAGDAYIVTSGRNTPTPGTGASQTTKWLVKLEPASDGRWVYSGVRPLWSFSGSTHSPVRGVDIWGTAFSEGKLYMAGTDSSGGNIYRMSVADTLTGIVTDIPGSTGTAIYDLASDGSLAALNGTVFEDQDRNGVFDGSDTGVAGQMVQLYDAAGTVVGEQVTNSAGEYSFLLPSANSNTYRVRVVQPQLGGVNAAQTGVSAESLCGYNEVTAGSFGQAIDFSMPPMDATTGMPGPYVDYPRQPGAGTSNAESLNASEMALYGEVDVVSDLDVSTVNFGISREGSWGDAGNGVSTFNTLASSNGPRHINPDSWVMNGGKDVPSLYLGPTPGWYQDGVTGDEHVTDDGVSFHIGGTEIPADQAVLAAGVSGYTFSVDVQGDKSSSGTVRAWLSNRNSNTFPNTLTASRQGPGEFSVDVPAGQVSNPSIRSFLRVDVTSSNNAIEGWHYNTDSPTTMFYAPQRGSEQSKTLDWVIDGEVEDHPIMVANAVARIQFEGVTGDYGVSAPSNTVVTPPSGGAATVPSPRTAVQRCFPPMWLRIRATMWSLVSRACRRVLRLLVSQSFWIIWATPSSSSMQVSTAKRCG